jgi:hypothetical protein
VDHYSHRNLAFVLAVLPLLILVGCAQKSPEEVVAETRTEYFLEPTGMLVQEPETASEDLLAEDAAEAEQGDEPAAAEAAAAAEEDEAAAEEAEGPRTVRVMFDVVVRFDGRKSLPGITIDISHRDPFEKEKARYQQWIETPGMSRGDARQLSFEKEISNYETGDQFAIEFRPFIPPEERGDYREFTEASP